MVLTFDPKAIFRETPHAKGHHDLVATTGFQAAGLHALQRYADEQTRDSKADAAARMHKLEGAREFWGVLLNLTEVIEAPKPRPPQNLNHHA